MIGGSKLNGVVVGVLVGGVDARIDGGVGWQRFGVDRGVGQAECAGACGKRCAELLGFLDVCDGVVGCAIEQVGVSDECVEFVGVGGFFECFLG